MLVVTQILEIWWHLDEILNLSSGDQSKGGEVRVRATSEVEVESRAGVELKA